MKKNTLIFVLCAALLAGCTTPGKRTAIGAAGGAAAGAAAGAALGAVAGNAGKGAWIGAIAGAVIGTTIGNYLDKQAKELEQIAETKRTEDGIVTTLKENILFDTGKSDLKPEAIESVNQISDIIKKYPEDRIVVAGYTDDRGSASYNLNLSKKRANAVRDQMIARGVPAPSVKAVGKGESVPISPNTSELGRSKNRRVELEITVDQEKFKG